MSTPPNSLTAIVITWGQHDELDGVLANLINQDRQAEEILVLDNDPEGSGRRAPHIGDATVRYLCPGVDMGRAAAWNRAAKAAKGDILLFLDDSVRFEKYNATILLLDAFSIDDAACQTFLIRNAASRDLIPEEFPGKQLSRWDDAHDVCYFTGCGFAIRRSVFQELGGFDEAFFQGEEDLDLSFRLIKSGKRIRYMPTIMLYHRLAMQRHREPRLPYRLVRNHTYLAAKHLPLPFLLSHLAVWNAHAIYAAIRGREYKDYFAGIHALWSDKLWSHARKARRENPTTWEIVKYLREHEGRLLY